MFRKLNKFIFIFFIFSCIFAGFKSYLKPKYVLPVLMYHSVNPVVNPDIRALIVTPEVFEKQMRFLKEHKYNVVTLDEAARLIKNKINIPANTVAITFDDGYKDNFIYVFPVLKKYNFPATIFIIVNEVGRQDRLSWQEIKEMKASGLVSFGSHALGAEPLVNLKPQAEIEKQIFESKRFLEQELGGKILAFSYPEGLYNENIISLVKSSGYEYAVATKGKRGAVNDPFLIKRLRISENCGNLFVFWFETTGYYNYLKERKRK